MSVAWLLGGLVLDVIIGWPTRWYRRIGHPVSWLGHLIDALDQRWNRSTRGRSARLWAGAMTTAVVVGVAAIAGHLLQRWLPDSLVGLALGALLVWPWLAARSLHEHVAAVAKPLELGDLPAARRAVSMIVGRDTERLDAAGVARAGIETLAENASDGVVAPLCWGIAFGLPGLFGYKAINTLDSMIGHRSDRYEAFGKVAARLDDVANWLPARLTALLFALACGRVASVLCITLRDARHHRSPNAGWPEAAMASALDVRLSGPRDYPQGSTNDRFLNARAEEPVAEDIDRSLCLYRRAGWWLLGAVSGGALLTSGIV